MAASNLSPEQYQALLNEPVVSPPPGVVAHLDEGPVHLVTAIVLITLLGLIATASWAMAAFTKLYIMKKASWSDFLNFAGWAIFVSYAVNGILLILAGGSKHIWDLRNYQYINFLYYVYIEEILFGVTSAILKTSILMQYRSIFSTKTRSVTWWNTHILTAVMIIFYTIVVFCRIFDCSPRSKIWNYLQDGTCLPPNSTVYATGVFNSVTDILILLIPQRVIWKLQMPRRQKIGISAVFLIGTIACITSIVRSYYSFQLTRSSDVPYTISIMGYWTFAEIFCGLLCANLPTLPRFFREMQTSKHASSIKSWTRSLLRSKATQSGSISTEDDTKTFKSYKSSNKSLGTGKGGYDEIDVQELSAFKDPTRTLTV